MIKSHADVWGTPNIIHFGSGAGGSIAFHPSTFSINLQKAFLISLSVFYSNYTFVVCYMLALSAISSRIRSDLKFVLIKFCLSGVLFPI